MIGVAMGWEQGDVHGISLTEQEAEKMSNVTTHCPLAVPKWHLGDSTYSYRLDYSSLQVGLAQ